MTQQESDFPAGLSAPALRALTGSGYTRLEQLSKVREADIKKLHGMGPKGIKLLRQALEARSCRLLMEDLKTKKLMSAC